MIDREALIERLSERLVGKVKTNSLQFVLKAIVRQTIEEVLDGPEMFKHEESVRFNGWREGYDEGYEAGYQAGSYGE